jgi:hypothetical protein
MGRKRDVEYVLILEIKDGEGKEKELLLFLRIQGVFHKRVSRKCKDMVNLWKQKGKVPADAVLKKIYSIPSLSGQALEEKRIFVRID